MNAVDDLVAFLRAVLDQQEAALVALREHRAGQTPCVNYAGQDPGSYDRYDSCSEHLRLGAAVDYRDPEFGLAEVEAKRRTLDRYESLLNATSAGGNSAAVGRWSVLMNEYELRILPALAQPYAGRPGWREEWAVSAP